MSFLAKILPALFAAPVPAEAYTPAHLAAASPAEKRALIAQKAMPGTALAGFAQDPDSDIRTLLAQRVGQLLAKMTDAGSGQLLLGAIRQLAEDNTTAVRVALASALKDVAHLPPALARQLAHDAERAVAEPIIRYSLGLSDAHLLELIASHPQDWHVVSIAQRRKLAEAVSEALAILGNNDAALALLGNDGATIGEKTLQLFGKKSAYEAALQQRNRFTRKFRRDIAALTDKVLASFLRQNAHLDQRTANHVLDKVHQRVDAQDNLSHFPPEKLTEDQLRDAVMLGQNDIVLAAVAAKAGIDADTAKRILVDAAGAKPIVALCVKAGLSMPFALLLQQHVAHLPAEKLVYPKDGTLCPLTPVEVQWQLEFFGIA